MAGSGLYQTSTFSEGLPEVRGRTDFPTPGSANQDGFAPRIFTAEITEAAETN